MLVGVDDNGLAGLGSPTVSLDVDLNNDDDFDDSGETGHSTGTLDQGSASFFLASALSVGTVKMRARVQDRAGNEGQSATQTVVVQADSSWTVSATSAPAGDARTGDWRLLLGAWTASHALDRLAQRLAVPHAPVPHPVQLEFHSEAGAPEGALYADGVLVAVLPGVTRL